MNISRYETNFSKNLFFNKTNLRSKKIPKRFEDQRINIYPEITYQTILGFGGALTEAAGYSFSKLSPDKKEQVINDYFSPDGLNYSFVRLPIGSCDFSLKPYSYSSKSDLRDFSIEKDKEYIIPFLKEAFSKNPSIKLLSSIWSPPRFMKNTHLLTLGGKLRKKHKQTLADYFVKYIQSYKNEGFNIDYVTVQNEPNAIQTWESCLYTAEDEADFAIKYLYPAFKNNSIDTKILIWDHNKDHMYYRARDEFSIEGANEAIAGVAYHHYSGAHFENLQLVTEKYPDKILLHTEGCTGYSNFKLEDEIPNANYYAHDILWDLNYGSNGYIDWNLMLDNVGGPNHKKNYCNSPIMLNSDETDYIKNLTYYYIGHFSKFIQVGAKRIAHSKYTDSIEVTSFINPDDTITVIILNRCHFSVEYNICINDKLIHDSIDGNSIVTYVFEK